MAVPSCDQLFSLSSPLLVPTHVRQHEALLVGLLSSVGPGMRFVSVQSRVRSP